MKNFTGKIISEFTEANIHKTLWAQCTQGQMSIWSKLKRTQESRKPQITQIERHKKGRNSWKGQVLP